MRPLQLEQPTRLRVIGIDANDFSVSTTEVAWWLGLPALVLLPVIVVPGMFELVYCLWTVQIVGALIALIFTTIGAGLLGLLVITITHERLNVAKRDVEWTLRLFALTLRRKILDFDKIDAVEVVETGGDEGSSYSLELRSGPITIRFGPESARENLDRLGQMIDLRRRKS